MLKRTTTILFRLILLTMATGLFAGDKYMEKTWRRKAETRKTENQVLLGVIYFGYGSASLTPSAMSQLAEMARRINGDFSYNEEENRNYRVKIVGFADSDGNQDYNMQLGMRRAESVAGFLEKLQMDMEGAVVASQGKSASTSSAKKFRRAEVWLENRYIIDQTTFLYVVVFAILIIIVGGGFYLAVISSGKRHY